MNLLLFFIFSLSIILYKLFYKKFVQNFIVFEISFIVYLCFKLLLM